MKHQALIVGLGQFGMSVARALAAKQVEVLAVDVSEDRVRTASAFVTEAACFDATDEASLRRMLPERRDVCLCAVGDEAREASIICTALFKQMGAKRVIARSNDDLHARILTLVGADQVVNPERAFGDRFANQILHQGIRGEMPLGDGLLVSEVTVPDSFVGKDLAGLKLPKKFGVTVVAVRRDSANGVSIPGPSTILESEDVMIVVAKERAVTEMLEKL